MEKSLRTIFINNLKYYRRRKGISQEKLSFAVQKSSTYINGIENKTSFPQPEVLEKLAHALDIRPSQLFAEEGCPDNAMTFDKDKFTEKVVEDIYSRLKADIHAEVRDVLDRK